MIPRFTIRLLGLLLGLLLCVLTTFAQTPTASVVGRVTDASGAVVPAVAVKITSVDTGVSQSGSSNDVGDFTIPFLNPGLYVMEASAAGFHTYRHIQFTLQVSQILRLDVKLEVGAVSESVTVNETAPVLNSETNARGEVTTPNEIKEMPLDGRNFTDLALLTGGVIPKSSGADGSFAVNGARADNGGFLLDGMNNT